MVNNTLKNKRKRYTFNSIEGGEAYNELKHVAAVPSHKQLTLRSISEAIEQDVTNLKKGIASVFEAVRNDISLENVQMESVELQLKKSAKRLNHTYDKVCDNRIRNQRFNPSSEHLKGLSDGVAKLSSNLDIIEDSTDEILENIVKIDARIPRKSRFLNGQVFNEQHYPLLFGLMRDKFGYLLEEQAEEADLEEIEETNVAHAGPSKSAEITSKSSDATASVDDLIVRYRMSQTMRTSSLHASDVFLPPSLRKASTPSTKTTFETISAKNIFKATPPT